MEAFDAKLRKIVRPKPTKKEPGERGERKPGRDSLKLDRLGCKLRLGFCQ
jgi:hypothetical protein